MSQPPDHVHLNRAYWDAQAAEYYVEAPSEEIWKARKR